MRSNKSFFNRHQVQEAILASQRSLNALIGRLPEPRANHVLKRRKAGAALARASLPLAAGKPLVLVGLVVPPWVSVWRGDIAIAT